jgi:hypothetical protein
MITLPVNGYSATVHSLLRRPLRPLIGALLLTAVAAAVIAAIAAHDATPLLPVFTIDDSATRSYVATKTQWDAAHTARTVAWLTAALSAALILSAFTIGVVMRRGARSRPKP